METALFAGSVLGILSVLLYSNFHGKGWITAGLFTTMCALVPFVYFETSGASKPLWLEWRNIDDSRVVAVVMDEPRGIYLWLLCSGETRPRSYALPWTISEANDIQWTKSQMTEEKPMLFRRNIDTPEQRRYRIQAYEWPAKTP